MSVAPAGAVIPLTAVDTRLSCAQCGARVSVSNAYCSRCGAANNVHVDRKGRPVDLAATHSLQLAMVMILANIVVGGLGLGIVVVSNDATHLLTAALGLELLHFVVIGGLVAATIRVGVRGIRETRDGRLRRGNWAILSVVIASLVGITVTGSLAATFVMFLTQS